MASVSELVDRLNDADYDPVDIINKSVDGGLSVQSQYPAAVQLMASLDEQSHTLHSELSSALALLQKSEKRLPHEIDLLKNDINTFNDQQSEKLVAVSTLARSTRKSSVFAELGQLEEIKARIESVRELLEEVQSGKPPQSTERARQFAVMLANTPDESKWSRTGTSYYEFINKIIN